MKYLLFSVSIKDCRVEEMTHGGKGGQHANRNKTAIRLFHEPSKAVGECRDFKSQTQNKRQAWIRLCNSAEFKKWHKAEVQRILKIKDVEKHSKINTGFGNSHIRTYTLSGKRQIKDHRSGEIRYDTDSVMNGDLESFIQASINKQNAM